MNTNIFANKTVTHTEVLKYLNAIPNVKTKDIDILNKTLIGSNADVSKLKEYVTKYPLLHRTYFQVSLGQMDDHRQQLEFIEANASLLCDWWQVDQLTQFINRPVDFEFAFEKARSYTVSDMLFLRRWGYVMFLTDLQKQPQHTDTILSLIKDDPEYYVRMAEAWLIADLAVFNMPAVKVFMENPAVSYAIAGRAIQKMCDSYRISKEDKEYMRSLRNRLK